LDDLGVTYDRVVLGGRYGERPDNLSFKLLDRFVAVGGRRIETAANYASGLGEKQIGRWLANRSRLRDSVIIIDKIGHGLNGDDACLAPAALRAELKTSLLRLKTDHVDLLLLHRDEARRPVLQIAETMADLLGEGLAEAYGVSNWRLERILGLRHAAEAAGFPAPTWASLQYSLAVPRRNKLWPGALAADAAMIARLRSSGIDFLAWSSQARGFFSTTYAAASDLRAAFDCPRNVARRDRAVRFGETCGISASAVALAYVIGTGEHVFASIGPETTDELDDSLSGARLVLGPDTRAMLWGDGTG
jgi:aryl-alcohol dehydrogenase-like predicted oxidoreductase